VGDRAPAVLGELPDYITLDGCAIRLLAEGHRGGLRHCTLAEGGRTTAVHHRQVEELWYCIAGQGEMWRFGLEPHELVKLAPGVSLTIPPLTNFQFRNTGFGDLVLLIVTMPPWPGPEEAVASPGRWA
jgi:mannose-6-phosphate isomerase-like protein (cupin superfamily)